MSIAGLEDILSAIPDAIIDVRYATDNNITGRALYRKPIVRLRKEPLKSLSFAAAVLRAQGYKLVVFDAYRSPVVQKALQEICPDPNYVALVSNHCRGITVDVTLADIYGVYLDMGTDYDDFTLKAHPDTTLITDAQRRNRAILEKVLHAQGFIQHENEWWHFDYEPGLGQSVIDSADNVI